MRYVSNLRRQTGEPLTGKPQRLQRFDGASCAGEARAGMRHARSHIIYVHLHPVWLAAAITHRLPVYEISLASLLLNHS